MRRYDTSRGPAELARRRLLAFFASAVLVAGCGAAGESADAGELGVPAQQREAPAAVPEDEIVAPPPAEVPLAEDPTRSEDAPMVVAGDDPLSTFAVDVDTGSYTLARATIRSGSTPDPSQVRVEEFVNALDQNYPAPAPGDVFAVSADGSAWPYAATGGRHLLRVGLSTADATSDRQPAALTFVVDTSGSMAEEGRLDVVREALQLLVGNLGPQDSIALVTYSDDARVILPPTSAAEPDVITDAIAELTPDGSTNLAAGLDLGYELARETLRADGINRVILASDGIANTGLTDGGAILETIRADAAAGIEMVTVGVGLGDFNDALMERLANDGDGFYTYVDTLDEANRVFGTELTSTLRTVAREARVQVEFDPAVTAAYRLLGFENRALPDEQFRDDSRDAGEVGAGHQVTALYEVEPTGVGGTMATVRLRWQDPTNGTVQELSRDVDAARLQGDFTTTDPMLQLDGVVAAWANAMRGDQPAATDPAQLAADASRIAEGVGTTQASEVAELIRRWSELRGV